MTAAAARRRPSSRTQLALRSESITTPAKMRIRATTNPTRTLCQWTWLGMSKLCASLTARRRLDASYGWYCCMIERAVSPWTTIQTPLSSGSNNFRLLVPLTRWASWETVIGVPVGAFVITVTCASTGTL